MARSLGPSLPPALLARFAAEALPTPGRTALLVTVDGDGLPHPCLLSDAEVVAAGARALRLAVHTASRTAGNLRAPGLATLALVEPEGVHFVKLRAKERASDAATALSCFEAEVVDVLEDAPRPGEGATVTSGIRWQSEGATWAERAAATRTMLRELR